MIPRSLGKEDRGPLPFEAQSTSNAFYPSDAQHWFVPVAFLDNSGSRVTLLQSDPEFKCVRSRSVGTPPCDVRTPQSTALQWRSYGSRAPTSQPTTLQCAKCGSVSTSCEVAQNALFELIFVCRCKEGFVAKRIAGSSLKGIPQRARNHCFRTLHPTSQPTAYPTAAPTTAAPTACPTTYPTAIPTTGTPTSPPTPCPTPAPSSKGALL